jgi:hypothetical protein
MLACVEFDVVELDLNPFVVLITSSDGVDELIPIAFVGVALGEGRHRVEAGIATHLCVQVTGKGLGWCTVGR